LLPDGGYTMRVVASDAPSHSPEDALNAEKESSRFEVDTTPPRVEYLSGKIEGSEMHITFRAVDSFSPIRRAEYSLDAGDWEYVEPVGQLSDAKIENYDFSVPVPGAAAQKPESEPPSARRRGKRAASEKPATVAEHVLVVRTYDRFDNMGSAKVVVKGQ
jgi:hypothetical protein